jgi:AcrR family transcriptional regulator
MTDVTVRERAADALMALAAEKAFERITIADVARRAGLSLGELREVFDTVLGILAAFTRRIDRKVLEAPSEDMAGEPARERLFDVLMRRFDELKPYRPALRSIARALRRDPLLAAAWNRRSVISMAWMLTAADIDTGGWLGRVRAQGLVFAYGRAFRVFLRDDDEGLARTMAELDRRLREGERRLNGLDRITDLFRRRRRSRRRDGDDLTAEYPA